MTTDDIEQRALDRARARMNRRQRVLAANSMRRYVNDGSKRWPGRPHAAEGDQQSNVRNAFPGALPIIAVAGEESNDGP